VAQERNSGIAGKSADFKKYFRLLGLVILLYILYKVDWSGVSHSFARMNPWLFVVAALLNFPLFALKCYRWTALLKRQGVRLSFKDAYAYFMASFFLGLVTPGRSGELVKVVYLRNRKVPVGKGFSSVFIDKLFDLDILLLFSFAGLLYFNLFGAMSGVAWAGVAAVVFAPLLVLHRGSVERLYSLVVKPALRRFGGRDADAHIDGYFEGLAAFNLVIVLFCFMITLASFVFFFLQCYLLAQSLGLMIPVVTLVCAISLSSIASLLPITFAGLGVREAVLIQLLIQSGFVFEDIVALSILFFCNFIIIAGLIGFVCWMVYPVSMKSAPAVQ
jgi:hypothetical protein